MKTYSGICYDGPLEGKRIDSSVKSVPFVERGPKKYEFNGSLSAATPFIRTEYRWCSPLRKWVYACS